MKAFFLVVVDRDQQVFSIHGPMQDDRRWNEACVAAQGKGRNVNCFTPGPNETREQIAHRLRAELGYHEVRSISLPEMHE
jgi:hypothetical protein